MAVLSSSSTAIVTTVGDGGAVGEGLAGGTKPPDRVDSCTEHAPSTSTMTMVAVNRRRWRINAVCRAG